ncbi:succinylglutamate desuccinylase [Klebsiella pneumoniae]|nr:succinylglutamate desuccinylase [Klebsiella pneumoniae]
MEHLVNDLLHCRLQAWTFPAGIEARWLGEGILQLLPTAPYCAWPMASLVSDTLTLPATVSPGLPF